MLAISPDQMLAELRIAFRSLWKRPGFTLMAVLTLGLAIAFNTTMFTVFAEVEASYEPPGMDRIYYVKVGNDADRSKPPTARLKWEHLQHLKRRAGAFDEVGGLVFEVAGLNENGKLVRQSVFQMDSAMFRMFGIVPHLGRTFQPEDDAAGGAHVVLLGYDFWQTHFGGRESVLGEAVILGEKPWTVIGVLPPAQWPMLGVKAASFYVPLSTQVERRDIGKREFSGFVRLREGFSRTQAEAELQAFSLAYRSQHPEGVDAKSDFSLSSHREMLRESQGFAQRTDRLSVLVIGSIAILLIACANVAALFLNQINGRLGEVQIRLALGAPMHALLRQFAWEGVIFSACAGFTGCLGAYWLCALARGNVGRIFDGLKVEVDWRGLAFTLVASTLVALLCSIAPLAALRRARQQPSLLNQARNSLARRSGSWMRALLLVSQVTMAMDILTTAGILRADLYHRASVDPGFKPKGLVSMAVTLPRHSYQDGPALARFQEAVSEKLRRSPEILAMAWNSMGVSNNGPSRFRSAEAPPVPHDDMTLAIRFYWVTPDFVSTTGLSVRAGRQFTVDDRADAAPVCMINEAMAEKLFGTVSPVGREVVQQTRGGAEQRLLVVGVVGNSHWVAPQAASISAYEEHVYRPVMQAGKVVLSNTVCNYWGRSASSPAALQRAVNDAVAAVDPSLQTLSFVQWEDFWNRALAGPRFVALSVSLYAGFAVLLAVLGLYTVVANSVVQRTPEIGVRMALGSSAAQVVCLLVLEQGKLLVIGLAVGIGCSLAFARILQSMISDLGSIQWLAYATTAVAFLMAGFLACFIPARRAAKIDPLVALRTE